MGNGNSPFNCSFQALPASGRAAKPAGPIGPIVIESQEHLAKPTLTKPFENGVTPNLRGMKKREGFLGIFPGGSQVVG